MKISEQWLREWVDPPLSTAELAEQLTMAGFEVDGLVSCAPDFKNIIIGRVEKLEAHPHADRLMLCQVNNGKEVLNVITGAANVAAGKCFPLALPGAVMPDGSEIRETSVQGLVSAGMLCSAAELGLSADAEKLFELDATAAAGRDLTDYLGLDDHVLELSLTPNRGDCLSLAGIAREVGVLNNLPVSRVEQKDTVESIDNRRSISLQAPSACPRYAGRIITGIDISRKAPDWILERLRRADLRSVNIVVDLTNYVMLEMGQPMHAFDNDKLSGEILVRYPLQEEELTLLDGQKCALRENTLLIADDSGPVAMAGIMGGLDTAVSDDTRDLFLESAFFAPAYIAGRARDYGLHTDASHRYERGVDYELQVPALERLTQLIIEYCGGRAGPLALAEEMNELPPRPAVPLDLQNIPRLLGVHIEEQRVRQILQQLGLGVEDKGSGLLVSVPSFRFDISIEVDLIEELARIYGYNNMASAPPVASLRMHGTGDDDFIGDLQQCLLHRGYHEIISYSFLDKGMQEKMLGKIREIPLLNPISSDLSVMRASLLPGLLTALLYNYNRQQERIRLFETGRVFRQENTLTQELMLAGIIFGKVEPKQWDRDNSSSDIYDIKNDIEAIIQLRNSGEEIEYRPVQHPALHPGQSAQIFIRNQLIGILGALHPGLLKEYDLGHAVYTFELEMSAIATKSQLKFTKISKFPIVKRDISILLGRDIPVSEVIKCIKTTAKSLLNNLELFDVYQGEGIDLEKKSLALGLTFQTSSSTLTDEEVEQVMGSILTALYSEFGATLRE